MIKVPLDVWTFCNRRFVFMFYASGKHEHSACAGRRMMMQSVWNGGTDDSLSVSQNIFETSLILFLLFFHLKFVSPPSIQFLFLLNHSLISFSSSPIGSETPPETWRFHLYYFCSFHAARPLVHLDPRHATMYLVIRWIPRRVIYAQMDVRDLSLSIHPSIHSSLPSVSLIGYSVMWGFSGGLLI